MSRGTKVAVVVVSLAAGVVFLARTPWVFTPNPLSSTFATTTTFVVSQPPPSIQTTTPETTQVPDTTQVVAEPVQPDPNAWPGCVAQASIPQAECDVLVTFYNDTAGEQWTNRDGWLIEEDPCEWFGVICADGSVVSLGLFDNQLSGPIPSELANLVNLQSLQIHFNRLSGPIPPELGSLGKLKFLSLSSNALSGSIPPELGNLTSLRFVVLNNNQLSGSIPPEFGNLISLEILDAAENRLSGVLPATLQQLEGTLSAVFLSGQIGCLTASPPSFVEFLDAVGPLWNDGC